MWLRARTDSLPLFSLAACTQTGTKKVFLRKESPNEMTEKFRPVIFSIMAILLCDTLAKNQDIAPHSDSIVSILLQPHDALHHTARSHLPTRTRFFRQLGSFISQSSVWISVAALRDKWLNDSISLSFQITQATCPRHIKTFLNAIKIIAA